jgi:hypothetical protein
MNDVAGRQPISSGDFRVASVAATHPTALGEQLGPGRTVNRAINATAAKQRTVRSVDDGVNA